MSFSEVCNLKTYKINSLIGEGGMAKVYLGTDLNLETIVAIKVLKDQFFYIHNIRKRFLAEAKSLAKMSHTNIVKVNDLINTNDNVAFVMEYIEGITLKEYIDQKGSLEDEEIIDLFSQMLNAVEYVHKQNLVHRDIKPSNFMIDFKSKVKLLDFGIAKQLNDDVTLITEVQYIMGTIRYMSPEQIDGNSNIQIYSDIYSLGVVLWEMVSGKKIFDEEKLTTFQLQKRVVDEKLPLTLTKWDSIIQKATNKNEEERFSNCSLFLKEVIKVNQHKDTGNIIGSENEFTHAGKESILYTTVQIGSQLWMSRNLDVVRFRNGDLIQEAKSSEQWKIAGENSQPAWCHYFNETLKGEKYGKLYNWFAVNDPRGLAPLGYHLPNLNELILLIDFLDGERIAGLKMKSGKGWNEKWLFVNGNGTNESGFNGLPGGYRSDLGIYNGENFYSGWWLTNELNKQSSISPCYFYLFNDSNRVMNANSNVEQGFYVRCLKDN